MVDIKELKDFKDTPYYKYYTDMIDEYWVKIVKSIVEKQWIDTDEKFTRADVLRETLKFVNWDLREFKDLEIVNPSRTEIMEQEIKDATERQVKAYLGIK
jgi:hypothetical protein